MDLSIVIPAYNEEKRIKNTLLEVKNYCGRFDNYEIIVVDDGSVDNTLDVVKEFNVNILKNEKNIGKGGSIKRGMLEAKYDYVLFMDADLATPISEFDKFLEFLDYDIVIASRNLDESKKEVKQPFYRECLGKGFPFLVNAFVLPGIRDTQCGFKLFKKSIVKDIFLKQSLDGWAFDVEILFIANKLGYKIKEVPVIWLDQEGSKLNPIKDAFNMFKDVFRIRRNDIKGRY